MTERGENIFKLFSLLGFTQTRNC